jgi:hypothetical protein
MTGKFLTFEERLSFLELFSSDSAARRLPVIGIGIV